MVQRHDDGLMVGLIMAKIQAMKFLILDDNIYHDEHGDDFDDADFDDNAKNTIIDINRLD